MPVLRSQNKPRPDDSVAPPQISQDQPPITTQTPPQPPPQVNRATRIPLTPTTPAPDARPRQHPSTPQRSTTQPSPSQRQPATPHRTQSTPFVPEKWNDKKTPIVWIAVSGIRKEKSTAFVYTTAIFKKLMASPELHSLIPLFNLCYRQSSTLLAQGRTFIMDEGVRQGCAAAPFFFHLALSLALEQLDADLRKSVHCVADDVLISDSSPARIRAILDSLVPAMAEIGKTVNPQKCVCVGPLSDLFTEFNSSTSVDYLGAFIALSESQQVTWEQLRGKYKQKLIAVEQLITTSKQPGSPISKQDCFLLLRYTCICFSYLLSNSNPKNTERVRDDLNKWMRAQLEAILESTLTDEQWTQSTLAARDGGLDLVDWGTTSAVTGKAYKLTQQLANSEQHSVNDPQVKQPSVFQIIKTVQQHAADELEHGDSTHYTKALRNVHSDGDDRVRWHAIRPNIGLRLTDQQWVTGACPKSRSQSTSAQFTVVTWRGGGARSRVPLEDG
jgi:hypothetical protein